MSWMVDGRGKSRVAGRAAAVTALLLLLVLAAACGQQPPGTPDGGSGAARKAKSCSVTCRSGTSTTLANWPARVILEEMGYDVVFQEAELGIIYQGTAMGEIDVFTDSWIPSQAEQWEAWGDRMERLGVLYEGALMGWIVPEYMEDLHSIEQLPEYQDQLDLNGNGLGDVLSYGAGSGASVTSMEVIEAYGLDYEVVDSSTAALLAAVQRQLDNEEPFLSMGWRPHWMFNLWPIKYLDDPEGIWKPVTVYSIAQKGFAEKNPELAKFFSLYHIPLEEFEAMAYEYNVEERDPEEIAREWVEQHRERVEDWIEQVQSP